MTAPATRRRRRAALPQSTIACEEMMSSAKELIIDVRIPLPTGLFEEAAAVAKVQSVIDAFQAALGDAVGLDYTLDVNTRATRSPRAPRSDKGQPRQPHLALTTPNGAGAHPDETA